MRRGIEPYIGLFSSCAKNLFLKKDLVILNIGVNKAHGDRAFIKGLDLRNIDGGKGHLYSMDINDCSHQIRGNDNWTFILGDSKKVGWDKSIDILFIDGDHTYLGCKGDYEKYEPFVVSGGLIFIHDILQPKSGAREYFEEITQPKIKLCLNNQGLGMIRKI